MSTSWGVSWGTSWANSWNINVTPTPTPSPSSGGGAGGFSNSWLDDARRKKKRKRTRLEREQDELEDLDRVLIALRAMPSTAPQPTVQSHEFLERIERISAQTAESVRLAERQNDLSRRALAKANHEAAMRLQAEAEDEEDAVLLLLLH